MSFEKGGVTTLYYPTKMHTASNIFLVGKMNMEGGGKKIIPRKFKLEREKKNLIYSSEICAILIPHLKNYLKLHIVSLLQISCSSCVNTKIWKNKVKNILNSDLIYSESIEWQASAWNYIAQFYLKILLTGRKCASSSSILKAVINGC